jgi:nucleoid DNA-binding protein
MKIDEFTRLVKEMTGGAFTLPESRLAIEAVAEAIRQVILRGDEVQLTGLGTFSRTEYKKTQGYDFRNKQTIPLDSRNAPKFTFVKSFKEEVKNAE